MKKTEFITILADAIEVDASLLNEKTVFADLDDYDSMAVMSIIAMADEHFSKKFTGEQLKSMKSVRNLMDMIGTENFTD